MTAAALFAGGAWPGGWSVFWDGARQIVSSPEVFRAWIDGFGAWAPAIFFVAEVIQVIVAPIPGSVFPAVGAAAFGPETGTALTLGGAAAGSAVVFALARRWGRPLAVRLVGEKTFQQYAGIAAGRGGLWLFLILLFPVLPGDAVCALAGVSSITLRRFLIVSTLGRLPGTVLSVYLVDGAMAGMLSVQITVAIVGVVVAGALLAVRYGSRMEAWLLHQARAHQEGS